MSENAQPTKGNQQQSQKKTPAEKKAAAAAKKAAKKQQQVVVPDVGEFAHPWSLSTHAEQQNLTPGPAEYAVNRVARFEEEKARQAAEAKPECVLPRQRVTSGVLGDEASRLRLLRG